VGTPDGLSDSTTSDHLTPISNVKRGSVLTELINSRMVGKPETIQKRGSGDQW